MASCLVRSGCRRSYYRRCISQWWEWSRLASHQIPESTPCERGPMVWPWVEGNNYALWRNYSFKPQLHSYHRSDCRLWIWQTTLSMAGFGRHRSSPLALLSDLFCVQSHPTTQNDKTMNYQRLEFIGDAVLDFRTHVQIYRLFALTFLIVVIRHLFHRHKTLSPGALTSLKVTWR